VYEAFLLLQETGFLDGFLKFIKSDIKSGFSYRKWYLPLTHQKMQSTKYLFSADCTNRAQAPDNQAPEKCSTD
jgi:hypothetical protein